MLLGDLLLAEKTLMNGLAQSQEVGAEGSKAYAHFELGHLLTLRGDFSPASNEFDQAQVFLEKRKLNQPLGTVWAYRALRSLLMGDSANALKAAQEARALAEFEHVERDVIWAEWLLGTSFYTHYEGLDISFKHLTTALKKCRRINLVELEPDILLSFARWHYVQGNSEEAQANSQDALAIARRCEYRLKEADANSLMARLALARNDEIAARDHANRAKERAWCDGPPHCYKPALDEAESILKELGEI
jgi:tetratricopeptide (TPR) repeat protein